jgi:hypothetical protein
MLNKTYSLDNIAPVGSYIYTGAQQIFMPMVLQALLSSDGTKTLRHLKVDGILTKPLEELVAYLRGKGGKCVIQDDDCHHCFFLWEDSFIDVFFDKKTNVIDISGYYLDPSIEQLVKELETAFISKVKNNLVFTIVKSGDKLAITNMGDASSPLLTDNYLPEVLEDIEFVIKSFGKTPPAGRICILNGEPGTGKTHLIRSILMQMDCIFLIVPSNLISSLDKPEFVPLLIDTKSTHNKSIVMIIEDGDVCLVPRKNDNISTIASLLNLSDGIMGSVIDIKMIISTNAHIEEMDAAILRPGRLCKNIHVGPLPYEQANRVYQRLMQDANVHLQQRRYYTLAEIYDRFNNIGSVQDVVNQRKMIGFSKPSPSVSDIRTMNTGKIGFEMTGTVKGSG